MNTIFIGIAGGTGSGKTTLTEHLKQLSATISASSITTAIISTRIFPSKNAASRTTTTPTLSKRI